MDTLAFKMAKSELFGSTLKNDFLRLAFFVVPLIFLFRAVDV